MTRRARRQLFEILSLLEEAGGAEVGESELQALDDRLGRLERELEEGLSAKVYEDGLELKNESLEFLNRLKEEPTQQER